MLAFMNESSERKSSANSAAAFRFTIGIFLVALAGIASGQDALSRTEVDFFETKIRPVLVRHCYACHSEAADENHGGLLLDTREGIRRGGHSGPAITPGRLQASLLISAIRHASEELAMPTDGDKLPDDVIRDFETWVRMGAPDPRDGSSKVVAQHDTSDAKDWWAFQPIGHGKVSETAATEHAAWPKTDIDRFIVAGWASADLSPVADADPTTLIRRLRFDLTGLPPKEEEVAFFVKHWNDKPELRDALIQRVTDWLLDSHEYAERWGRHWLDVARYAESSGKDVNLVYPHAWRYRDYVIESFHQDKPFDRFVREQIAGDLLDASDASKRAEQLTATGFLAIGENPINERNPKQFAVDLADDQIGTVTQAFLGMTVSCARCHDHRFDPVSQKDYTSLAGIFLSTETKFGTAGAVGGRNRAELIELPKAAGLPIVGEGISASEIRQMQSKLARLQEQQSSARRQRAGGGRATDGLTDFDLVRINTQISQLEFELSVVDEDGSAKPLAMGVGDRPVTAPATRGPGGPRGAGSQGDDRMTRPTQGRRPRGPGEMRGPNGMQGTGGMQDRRGDGMNRQHPPLQNGSQVQSNPFAQPMTSSQNGRVRSSGFQQIGDSPLFLRGNIDNASDPVPRGVPALLGSGRDIAIRSGSGRLELADALVSKRNTLTARVIVNRVWHWLFGRGLVATVDNFGTTGDQPSHPELLDHLANQFVDNGWSIKQLIREITTSRVYRLSSTHDDDCFAADPSNAMLWRHSSRRLEAEELRDAVLAASGQLNLQPTPASLIGRAGDGPIGGLRFQAVTLDEIASADDRYRSIYLPATRSVEPDVLAVFDPTNASVSDGSRDATNVPAQALFLLNSDFIEKQSQALADDVLKKHAGRTSLDSFESRLRAMFRSVLNRDPSERESTAARTLIQQIDAPRSAWTSLARGLFGSAEFRFVD